MAKGNRLLACLLALLAITTYAEPVLVGLGVHKPPYIDEVNRRGLEYDLIVAAFKAGGMEAQIAFYPQERMHALMANGQLGAIGTTNEQSGVVAHYSSTYIIYHNYAISLASHHLEIHGIESLAAYSVAAFQRARKILGPRFEAMASANPRYVEVPLQITRNRLLYIGRIDVAIADRRIFDYFNQEVGKQVDTRQEVVYHDIFPPTAYKMAFADRALRDRFDAGLAAIRKNGVYARIEGDYAQSNPP